jgi:hypothetical protein
MRLISGKKKWEKQAHSSHQIAVLLQLKNGETTVQGKLTLKFLGNKSDHVKQENLKFILVQIHCD